MKPRSGWLIAAGLITLVMVAVGGLVLIGPVRTATTPSDTTAAKRGNSGKYLYAITDLKAQNKKIAQFDPSLPTDEAVVLDALRALAKDGYGAIVGEEVPPVVVSLNEVNYVTFSAGDRKLYYELFRNSSGQVGSVRFWRE